jgi:tetratricopeptide (TPR) repeat protein
VAKKRASARKRRREFLRQALAVFFVVIFVLGTATTAFIFTGQQAATTAGGTPLATIAAQTTAEVSPVVSSDLEKKGDDALAQNKLTDALSFYRAASALDQSNAELYYKTGSLLIQMADYPSAADQLARAVELDGTGPIGTQAKGLMDQNKDKLPTRVISTGAPGVKGVVSPAAPITNTNPGVVTLTPSK